MAISDSKLCHSSAVDHGDRIEQNSPLRTALRLETITIIWMVIEAIVAIGAELAARSLLLFAFGLDSGIELTSAIVVFLRFRFELNQESESDLSNARDVERKTARIAGYLLMLLSAYIIVQAIFGLVTQHAAETSAIGIAVAVVAAVGMPVLARAKLRVADKIDSRSLRADAIETLTCGYLSWVLLAGLTLNAVAKWWWTDSVASLAIIPLLVREAREALSGKSCSGCDAASFRPGIRGEKGGG
jgi:divalent metal cation (Fe/Co/Zn/Cd) transporter